MGITIANKESSKRNFSKYDVSGTDPNRYASVSNTAEAYQFINTGKKSIIPGLTVNVGTAERIFMVAAGSYLLYRALKKKDNKKIAESITGGTMLFRGISGYCPAYDAISKSGVTKGDNITATASLTIDKPVEEVYAAWRDLESHPQFMKHLDSVTVENEYISDWKAKLPGGIATVGWKAEILMDEPNRILSWHSMPGSALQNAGKVKFDGSGDSTNIEVTISYHAPLGKPGAFAAKLLNGKFETMLQNDIENFKEYIETGKVAE
jgi:uncharacterized membrane protein